MEVSLWSAWWLSNLVYSFSPGSGQLIYAHVFTVCAYDCVPLVFIHSIESVLWRTWDALYALLNMILMVCCCTSAIQQWRGIHPAFRRCDKLKSKCRTSITSLYQRGLCCHAHKSFVKIDHSLCQSKRLQYSLHRTLPRASELDGEVPGITIACRPS